MASVWRYLDPAPPPPPGQHVDRVLYGLMQPILGARLLLREPMLLRAALLPVGLLAAFCALWGLIHLDNGPGSAVRHFYRTFAVLAPLPSVLMATHYGRMVMRARACLSLPAAKPRLESLWRALCRAVAQAVLIALAIAPATFVLHLLPALGRSLIQAAAAIWALHWIVVDAFDASRVCLPGRGACVDRRRPWFVRALFRASECLPLVGGLLRTFTRFCDRLARPWREEIAVVEDHPMLMLGFAMTTAALLATPVLNLFFRPIVLVGAVHVLGHFELAPPDVAAGIAPGQQ